MAERFSAREIVELILAIGYYMMVARLLETTGVEIDTVAGASIYEHATRRGRVRPPGS